MQHVQSFLFLSSISSFQSIDTPIFDSFHYSIVSVESQKSTITINRCTVENQRGAVTIDLYSDSALLVLNRTSLSIDNALVILN